MVCVCVLRVEWFKSFLKLAEAVEVEKGADLTERDRRTKYSSCRLINLLIWNMKQGLVYPEFQQGFLFLPASLIILSSFYSCSLTII